MDKNRNQNIKISNKSFTGTLLLTFFLGWLGVHRFYVGRFISGTLILMIPFLKLLFALYFMFITIELQAVTVEPITHTDLKQLIDPIMLMAYYAIDISFWAVSIIRFYDIVLLAGHRFRDATGAYLVPKEQKAVSHCSYFATLMLARYTGLFGLHRFYVGKSISGFFMAITLGGLGVWWLVDQILIMTQKFNDADERVVLLQ